MTRPIRWALGRAGWEIISKDDMEIFRWYRYGIDPLRDIQSLSQEWNYSIGLFFDVGAHCGATIKRVRRAFKSCHVVAFEPHPKTFSKLQELTAGIEKLELVNIALGSRVGIMKIFEYSECPATNSLVKNAQYAVRFAEESKGEIDIACSTIDEFCFQRKLASIDVLKIDTEGYDLEVLKGARSMLDRQAIKFIYFEFNDICPRTGTFGGALIPIDDWVRQRGYRFIASYIDYLVPEGELFLVANALYALPPTGRPGSRGKSKGLRKA